MMGLVVALTLLLGGGGSQCSDLAIPWTTVWQAGELSGGEAFALELGPDALTVEGLRCGKGTWQVRRVCISGADQVLWVLESGSPAPVLVWGLPYEPAEVAVEGVCLYGGERWHQPDSRSLINCYGTCE